MKVKPIYWIALFLALALTVAVCDGLKIRDKASVIAGQYQESLDQAQVLNAEKDSAIAEANMVIAEKTKEISSILVNASKPSSAEIAKDVVIATQHKKIAEFEAQGDLVGALEASKAESRAWSEKFQLAEEQHGAELFDLNASWQAKFNAQVVVSESWKAKYDAECRISQLAKEGWDLTAKKLKKSSIISNAKTILIYAGVVVVGLEKVKGIVNKGM